VTIESATPDPDEARTDKRLHEPAAQPAEFFRTK
jgi:hypothetical protein